MYNRLMNLEYTLLRRKIGFVVLKKAGRSVWLERSTDNRKVGSSNPPRHTRLTFNSEEFSARVQIPVGSP
jgi:hypothetical protein